MRKEPQVVKQRGQKPVFYFRIKLLVAYLHVKGVAWVYTSIALFQGPQQGNETAESSSSSLSLEKDRHQKNSEELDVEVSENNQNSIVTSLAEKAMSVAGPVVPTKDGEVDQERSEDILPTWKLLH